MLRLLNIAVVAIVVLLTGCAASVQRSGPVEAPLVLPASAKSRIVLVVRGSEAAAKSADWEVMRAEWRTAMSSAAAAKSIAFAYQEAESKSGGDGTAVTVRINDYRYLSTGARYGLGVMTGNAYLDTDVSFVDLKSGRAAGTRKYNTSSSAWQGVFSAMTSKQVEGICAAIVEDVVAK
jgi:hypothetical protein